MDYAPEVHWRLARRIARFGQGELPEISRPDAIRLVNDIRLQAREAGAIAATTMNMPDAIGATDIRVVDREGWARAATEVTQAALDSLDWKRRPPGIRRAILGHGLGAGLGVGLAVGSRWMLGQFDSFTGNNTLYLVAPNIYRMEQRHGFVPADFRRWVAIHEQTHALQFQAAPWLGEYMAGLIREAQSRATVDRIVGIMTFLEGHADYISDHTGRVRTASTMRKAFGRKPKKRAGILNKAAQYANGLEFCIRVRRLGRRGTLMAAFEKPENLPTRAEINDPGAWVTRIHG